MPRLALAPVAPADFEPLLALRIRAMRPSLEALGRFDPQRARARFESGFAPEHMQHLVRDGQRVGLITLRPLAESLRIEHLYVEPEHQGQGIGAWALRWACVMADLRGLPLTLAVLQRSDALRFYRRHGFDEVGTGEIDIELARAPRANPVEVVRSLWQRFEQRDWDGARTLLHDGLVARWWTSGERFGGADAYITVQRIYPEGWSIHLIEATPLADGRVLALARVDHGADSFFCTAIASVHDGRIDALDEWWATWEAPPAWRHPGSIAGWSRFDAKAAA